MKRATGIGVGLIAFGVVAAVPPAAVGATQIVAGGAPVQVTVAASGATAQLTFDGTAGQRISLKMTASTIANSKVTIKAPSTVQIASASAGSTGFIDTKLLTETGTYTILVDPASTYTGSMTLTLYDVPTDATAPITAGGGAVGIATAIPGQDARLTFTGTAGQRVSVGVSGNSYSPSAQLTLLQPDGVTSSGAITVVGKTGFLDTRTLPATGTYTLSVNPRMAATGGMTVTLYSVPADVGGSITANGAAVGVATAIPGQDAALTFTATAGQRVSVRLTANSYPTSSVSIVKPDGVTTVTSLSLATPSGFIDVHTLDVAGTYKLLVDPKLAATGGVTVQLYTVPADVTGPIVAGGSAVAVATATPGQNARLTFTATAGQRVSLKLTASTYSGGATVSILNPDGVTSAGSVTLTSATGFLEPKTLAQAGTYTVLVNPKTFATGGVTVNLYTVPADQTGTITLGGSAVNLSFPVPGQNARLTFTGTAGRAITLTASASTLASVKLTILKPDSTSLKALTLNTSSGSTTTTLPTAGTYTLVVDPQAAASGAITVKLT